jgi:hypothetical protein
LCQWQATKAEQFLTGGKQQFPVAVQQFGGGGGVGGGVEFF